MPIANCIVTPDCQQSSGNLVELWASESGNSSDHMTVNIITSNQQLGNQYSVMANLLLPSIWTASDISAIQTGLARALAKSFNVALTQVHIVTNIVSSGLVVEEGQEMKW